MKRRSLFATISGIFGGAATASAIPEAVAVEIPPRSILFIAGSEYDYDLADRLIERTGASEVLFVDGQQSLKEDVDSWIKAVSEDELNEIRNYRTNQQP